MKKHNYKLVMAMLVASVFLFPIRTMANTVTCTADSAESLFSRLSAAKAGKCTENVVNISGTIDLTKANFAIVLDSATRHITVKCASSGCGLKHSGKGTDGVIRLESDRNVVDGLTITAPSMIAILIEGDDNTVKNVKVKGATGACISISTNADKNTVSDNELYNCNFGAGINVDGDDNIIKSNTIGDKNGIYGDCIHVNGSDNIIEANSVNYCDNYGIYLQDSTDKKDVICSNVIKSTERYTNVDLGERYFTSGGTCLTCADGQKLYNNECVDVCKDGYARASTGKCVLSCPAGQVASSDVCVCSDPTKSIDSNGDCVTPTSTCGVNEKLVGTSCVCKDNYGRYSNDTVDGVYVYPCVKCGSDISADSTTLECNCGAKVGYVRTLRGSCMDESYGIACNEENAFVDGSDCRCNDGFVNSFACPAASELSTCAAPTCRVVDIDTACAACLAKGSNYSCNEETGACSESAAVKSSGDCKCNLYAKSEGTVAEFIPLIFLSISGMMMLVWRRKKCR